MMPARARVRSAGHEPSRSPNTIRAQAVRATEAADSASRTCSRYWASAACSTGAGLGHQLREDRVGLLLADHGHDAGDLFGRLTEPLDAPLERHTRGTELLEG